MSTHWIVVADASRARIVDTDDLMDDLNLVRELEHAPARAPVRDLVSGDRGWSRAGPRMIRTAFDRHSDPRRVESRAFARTLADVLERGLQDRAYERLVLCAPPQFLGEIREALPKEVTRRVVASASHDWTAEPLHTLSRTLRRALHRAMRRRSARDVEL